MDLSPQDFSIDAFAGNPLVDFPEEYPLSYGEIQHQQQEDKDLQQLVRDKPQNYEQQMSKTPTRIMH